MITKETNIDKNKGIYLVFKIIILGETFSAKRFEYFTYDLE